METGKDNLIAMFRHLTGCTDVETAKALGVTRQTVWSNSTGRSKINGALATALRYLCVLAKYTNPMEVVLVLYPTGVGSHGDPRSPRPMEEWLPMICERAAKMMAERPETAPLFRGEVPLSTVISIPPPVRAHAGRPLLPRDTPITAELKAELQALVDEHNEVVEKETTKLILETIGTHAGIKSHGGVYRVRVCGFYEMRAYLKRKIYMLRYFKRKGRAPAAVVA